MRVGFGLGIALAGIAAVPAHAQEASEKWFVRGALTRLELADKIDLFVSGAPFPGTALKTKAHYTPTIHIGRMVGRDVAVMVTAGLPPHIDINGAGTLEPFGKLAETTYGPACITIQYRPVHNGPVQPYVGAGVTYMFVFSETDAAFDDVEIDEDLGPTVEAGAEFMLTPKHGIFVEAKKAFLRTETRGSFAGMPVRGDVKLDPWAISVGAVIRF